jgi:hypothetical protein
MFFPNFKVLWESDNLSVVVAGAVFGMDVDTIDVGFARKGAFQETNYQHEK